MQIGEKMMAAVGRKRKNGEREANGRLSRALASRESVAGTMRDLAIIHRERLDPALGSPIGCMLREGKILTAEYDAGVKFAALRAAADRALGLPPRNPAALDYNAARGLSLTAERDPENDRAVIRAYDDAEAVLGTRSPELAALQAIVIYTAHPSGYEQFLALKKGLSMLSTFWRCGR